jgi:biotin synthase
MDWERYLFELKESALSGKVERENLLPLKDLPPRYLPLMVYAAGEIKFRRFGDGVEFCSILNAKSGACSQDCKFCAQSVHYKTGAPVYPFLDIETVLKAAEFALKSGSKHFSFVLSGKAAGKRDLRYLSRAAAEVKRRFPDLKLCVSAGTLKAEDMALLKEAGFERLHHNLETSKKFFPNIVSTHSWCERYETVKTAKGLSFEVCSGGLFGLGESWEDRVDLALTLSELKVDSIPLNFLIPIKGTPLENRPLLSAAEALKIIALFRFANPSAEIRLAGGRERILGDFLGMATFMVNAHMVGGYLTRAGRDPAEDRKMLKAVGLPKI